MKKISSAICIALVLPLLLHYFSRPLNCSCPFVEFSRLFSVAITGHDSTSTKFKHTIACQSESISVAG